MRIALVAALVVAAVAAGSALAVGRPAAPHAKAPRPHAEKAPPAAHRPLSDTAVQKKVAAWSAAHAGWTNPADMTHAQMLQAVIAHPAVYAPDLANASRVRRLIAVYGTFVTMSPSLRALERAHGVPIPAGIPYVPPSAYIPAARLAQIKAALRAARRP